jgi:asparagine synthase (glutamine-hydrolysing)
MPGFSIAFNTGFDNLFSRKRVSGILYDSIKKLDFQIERFVLNQFVDDKLFVENEEFIILLDGVITNISELLITYDSKQWYDCVIKMYRLNNNSFFELLRGSFRGLFFDKIANRWLIFTDHIGTKPLYIAEVNQGIFISSEMSDHYQYFKSHGIPYTMNEDAAYMLLSYGFMLDDITLCKQVKKLPPGHYIEITNQVITKHSYYTLPETFVSSPSDLVSDEDNIEQLDALFKKAIIRQFQKDKEYDYRHFVALSGGLDSRMTCYVADEIG